MLFKRTIHIYIREPMNSPKTILPTAELELLSKLAHFFMLYGKCCWSQGAAVSAFTGNEEKRQRQPHL